MKKSTVALGLIVALGGAWVGVTWYSGKTIENQFRTEINNTNQKLDQFFNNPSIRSNGSVKIDNVKFQRGIFSSDISYDVVFITKSDNSTEILPFSGTLFHGPLPLNQLIHFDFKPVIFSAETAVVKTDKNKNWFGKNGQSPLFSNFALGYDKQIFGKLNSDVAAHAEGGALVWKLTADYNLNQDGFGRFDISLPHFKLTEPASQFNASSLSEKPATIEFTDAKTQLQWNLASPELNHIIIGKYDAQVGSMRINGRKNNKDYLLEIKDINTVANGNIKNDFVDYGLTYKLGEIHFKSGDDEYKLLNEAILNMQFNHLAAKSLNILFSAFTKASQHPDQQVEMSPEVIEAAQALYENQLQVKLAPVLLSNSGGKITVDFDMATNGNFIRKMQSEKPLDAFKQFDLNAHIDNAAILELMTQLAQFNENTTKEKAAQEAKQKLDGLLPLAKTSPLFIVDDNSVKLNIKLENDKINLNGNMLSLEEFIKLINGAPTNTNAE